MNNTVSDIGPFDKTPLDEPFDEESRLFDMGMRKRVATTPGLQAHDWASAAGRSGPTASPQRSSGTGRAAS